jgi:hypothetical protein
MNTNRSGASWTAVAKRSGDTAFARAENKRTFRDSRPRESGVALRFPPQSKARPSRFHTFSIIHQLSTLN